MALPPRNGLDTQQTWATFKAWMLQLWDVIYSLPYFYYARGAWMSGVAYGSNDYVSYNGFTYVAMLAHTSSGDFAADLAAGKWEGFNSAAFQVWVDKAKNWASYIGGTVDGTDFSAKQKALDAAASEANATAQATIATTARTLAEAARDASLLSRGIFATTAKALSKGVIGHASLVAGSGGTNGTFDVAFTGGAGSGAAARFTVAGGALVSILYTATGDSYTSAPAMSFAASTGLTGASATAVIANNVDPGEYFSYPLVGANNNMFMLAQNVAGAAVAIGPYALTDIIRPTLADSFVVSDSDGNESVRFRSGALVDVQSDFTVDSFGIEVTPFRLGTRTLKYWMGLSDSDGNLAFAVSNVGQMLGDASLTTGRKVLRTGGSYDYDICFFPQNGQSLSVGQAAPAISTVQRYDNLMFTRGMRPQYDYVADSDAVRYASLIPAVEAQSPVNATLAETPAMGAGDMIKQLMLDEDGISFTDQNYQMLLSTPGFGATAISGFAKGGTHYTRMMTQATYGASLAAAAGKTFGVPAVSWTQGENDYLAGNTQASYATSLNTLVSDQNTDFKAISGQTKDVLLISYQIASHKVNGQTVPAIALAQTQVAASNPLVVIATPMYIFEYQDSNNNHLMPVSSRWMGAYYGLAYKRVVIDGLPFVPVKAISSTKSGAIANVKFSVPVGKLVFDTTLVALNTNYGFELVDSGGTAITINSVAIRGTDTVRITAATTIPSGAKLRYGWSGAGNVGRQVGPRGNLRDQQGEDIPGSKGLVFDPNGINKPMHNWAQIQEFAL